MLKNNLNTQAMVSILYDSCLQLFSHVNSEENGKAFGIFGKKYVMQSFVITSFSLNCTHVFLDCSRTDSFFLVIDLTG